MTTETPARASLVALVRDGGSAEAVSHLVASGAGLDEVDGSGRTAVYWAARLGLADLVAALLAAGASPLLRERGTKASPLAAAVAHNNILAVDELLRCGREVGLDAQDAQGKTPLHIAAEWGFTHIVLRLLDAHPALDLADNEGRLPVHLAANDDIKALLDAANAAEADLGLPHVGGSVLDSSWRPQQPPPSQMLVDSRVDLSLEDALVQEEVSEVNRLLTRELNARAVDPYLTPMVLGVARDVPAVAAAKAEFDARVDELRKASIARKEWLSAEMVHAEGASDRLQLLMEAVHADQMADNAMLSKLGHEIDALMPSEASGDAANAPLRAFRNVHSSTTWARAKAASHARARPAHLGYDVLAPAQVIPSTLGAPTTGESDIVLTASARLVNAASGALVPALADGTLLLAPDTGLQLDWEVVLAGDGALRHVMGGFVCRGPLSCALEWGADVAAMVGSGSTPLALVLDVAATATPDAVVPVFVRLHVAVAAALAPDDGANSSSSQSKPATCRVVVRTTASGKVHVYNG
ncbi:uncharacterized protein AMSG_06552 [Thecamonas trahens ATCC 50062]|uniref:Uncharacterized protein n=1 Tax=Thecamonas trahens ATCC 50062 TaxID=461836 RepID=A0A0L0DIP2_THETB|nr:hypothetical protein AMSG_06552 [Thecamonas trahens ATCC 50062]KNC51198.1 hypothetical protein AMSG_06552 [Thecamonas trahens ATCC 50062]|eukprot:XP_013756398.1 hypothetical protein AMSG_06552 [Thecamonas trahens ATCC 50062]